METVWADAGVTSTVYTDYNTLCHKLDMENDGGICVASCNNHGSRKLSGAYDADCDCDAGFTGVKCETVT